MSSVMLRLTLAAFIGLPSCTAAPEKDGVELRLAVPKGWQEAMAAHHKGQRAAPLLVLVLEDLDLSRLAGRTVAVLKPGTKSTEALGTYTFVGDPREAVTENRTGSIRIPLVDWRGPESAKGGEVRLVVACPDGAAVRFRQAVLEYSQ